VVDGRRAEVFVGRYARGAGGFDPVELAAPSRHAPEAVLGEAIGVDAPVLVCGDGALRYRSLFERPDRVVVAGGVLGAPDPAVLVRLAMARLDAGAAQLGAIDVLPVYLRDADARINWVQRAPVATGG